ncbi:poly-gamma-glutamate synthesis protein (capsule biosynthesis protein) [Halorubrum californiense DSM 19288]|uniref:Poly-gamma-glutamate synthesis protein (Capsule biosynthesis protein) n=1 Tax=Halorubrum californiense DSM 19288 TaxID=1227465 RepID=M0EQ31_9EURY|nr:MULTISPECIES: CapA family protein [Halorubrum]ELZ48504.1 poly-gamma-glutamate synthesis protein (capsule biosynthesis protein) [Halorubrum californiense DSM 19288]TKX68704.1 CapA family protein [Halorubrum sp. GN11GM_10-3_MGM]
MVTRRSLLAASVAGLGGTAGCAAAPPSLDASDDTPGSRDGADDTARIGFVGDLMLGRSVADRWADHDDPTAVWGTTLPRLRDCDALVGNLECCVSDRGERWPDKVYYFRSPPSFAIPALEAAGGSFVSLANNHVLDYQETALRDTRTHLADAGIARAGAGANADAALEPATFEAGDLTVGAFGLTDQSTAFAATASKPGTAFARLDPAVRETRALVGDILDRVAGRDPDLVVASLHWGPNWATEPRAVHERFGRWLVECGVDVVHGHSAHVLQGVEVYEGRPIIYDAGDFVDDYVSYRDREGVRNKRSALFELVVRDGDPAALDVLPTEIGDETATLAEGEVAEWVRETVAERSAAFGTEVDGVDGERDGGRLRIPLGRE